MDNDDYGKNALMAIIIMVLAIFGGGIIMADCMKFPDTVEEFMEQYKVTDYKQIYTNGAELVPIFRMKQWFERQLSVGVVPAEPQEIGYNQCANAMLKMWMDNVVTDGEYYRIMNKLNKLYFSGDKKRSEYG